MSPTSESLLALVRDCERHFWVGEVPPFEWDQASILHSSNFRLSPSHHRQYDVVWLYESLLSDFPADTIELILDELVRLVRDEGRMVLRYAQHQNFSVILLKHLLGRRYNLTIDVETEIIENGIYTTVFRLQRLSTARYSDQRWTFAIITQGKRRDNVIRFLQSVRQHATAIDHELLICGPADEAYAPFKVTYLDREYRDHYAEIALKKNDIADRASCANLLIAHDRYVLNDDFFSGFAKYGYDFDFITIKQWYESGEEFPAYCAMSSPDLVWSPPVHCTDINRLRPLQFLNGGLFIAKTETLRDLRMNPLLFWQQAEDVELTKHLRNHGLPPRINVYSSATTIGIKPDHTKNFRIDSNHSSSFKLPWIAMASKVRDAGRRMERFVRTFVRPKK